jgi:hypothetical protein
VRITAATDAGFNRRHATVGPKNTRESALARLLGGRVQGVELWPLLTDDLLSGVFSTERQLRPKTTAVAVSSGSIHDFQHVVRVLCTRWGGAFSPLLVVKPGSDALEADVERWLLNSNIDGMEVRHLMPNQLEQQFSDRWANAHQWLLRQVAYDGTRHVVQTCRGVPTDSPWYAAYLVLFGDLPDTPNRERNRRNDLRDDLTFADIVDLAEVDAEPSVNDITADFGDTAHAGSATHKCHRRL